MTKRTAWERRVMVVAQFTLDIGSKVKKVATVKRQLHQAKFTMENGH